MLTCLQFFPLLGLLICISRTSLLPEQSSSHFYYCSSKEFTEYNQSVDTCFDSLSCLGFTDLVFFFFQKLKDISYPINCFINNVICSICLNNSMSLLHLVPYSLYFACDISGLSQVFIHLGNCSFSFSCVPVLWVLIPFLFQDQNSKVLKKMLLSF